MDQPSPFDGYDPGSWNQFICSIRQNANRCPLFHQLNHPSRFRIIHSHIPYKTQHSAKRDRIGSNITPRFRIVLRLRISPKMANTCPLPIRRGMDRQHAVLSCDVGQLVMRNLVELQRASRQSSSARRVARNAKGGRSSAGKKAAASASSPGWSVPASTSPR